MWAQIPNMLRKNWQISVRNCVKVWSEKILLGLWQENFNFDRLLGYIIKTFKQREREEEIFLFLCTACLVEGCNLKMDSIFTEKLEYKLEKCPETLS